MKTKPGISALWLATTLSLLILFSGCKKEPSAPSVETVEIVAPSIQSILVGGKVTDSGGEEITARGFVGCTLSSPTLERHTFFSDQGTGSGYFESLFNNVDSATWYFRAYAVNQAGVGYGEEKSINPTEESLYYRITMGQDDYQYLVDIDPLGPQLWPLNDFAYYYGASSFYENFDFRLQSRRLDKDAEGNYVDPELGVIFETQGADAAIDEMYNRLFNDGLIELLRHRYPNARPAQGSREVEYVIEFEVFFDNWVKVYPFVRFRCTTSGNPPDFELVESYGMY
ncbi:MAG: hypothetical protein EA361_06290 [Bacteroidetes bacterium]|nr:MAG: hypothetical protein EA361_06290 [Bacteroidota bacterium]